MVNQIGKLNRFKLMLSHVKDHWSWQICAIAWHTPVLLIGSKRAVMWQPPYFRSGWLYFYLFLIKKDNWQIISSERYWQIRDLIKVTTKLHFVYDCINMGPSYARRFWTVWWVLFNIFFQELGRRQTRSAAIVLPWITSHFWTQISIIVSHHLPVKI